MFIEYSPIEYLCINIANHWGLDKKLFSERIQWVKDNYRNLEELSETADEKPQYIKAVMALRTVESGKPTGHLIPLDGVCSGIQLMSCITGCKDGASITGLVDPNKRSDAYTEIGDCLNDILSSNGLDSVKVTRSDAKDAIMPSVYGSLAKPVEIFGEDLVKYFHEACIKKAKGAFTLLRILVDSWQSYSLSHNWYMPDGYYVHIKSMETVESKIEIDELGHHTFDTAYKINVGSKKGLSLAAHTVHSIDAYVLRTMIRRTNYNRKILIEALALIDTASKAVRTKKLTIDEDNIIYIHSESFEHFKMVDATAFADITADNVYALSKDHLKALLKLGTTMLEHPSFEMLTVHDEFRAHAKDCNRVRYWYKEILAELAESQILNVILEQITGTNPKFQKLDKNLPTLIRNSNYGLS